MTHNQTGTLASAAAQSVGRHVGEKTLFIRSPGRVNLLGEHTDYNEGFVLPAAIGNAIYLAITPRVDNLCILEALDMHDQHHVTLPTIAPSPKRWPNYLLGVVDQLQNMGHHIGGFHCVFSGDIPIGAGLSSSAALETGCAFGLNRLFSLGIDDLTIVKLSQKAENDFVGVQCGIMDQYVNMFGKKGKVLRIDCRSLEHTTLPFDYPGISIVLFDTRVTHSLASTEYNQRRQQCQVGVNIVRMSHPSTRSLRDVTRDMLEESQDRMPATVYRRCSYVVGENERMARASAALQRRDLKGFGELMYLTHDGLRDDYAVSCPELDALVEFASANSHVHGARMMGGGFGGCTINLVDSSEIEGIRSEVAEKYKERFHADLKTYVTEISSGTHFVNAAEDAVPEKRGQFPIPK